MASHGRELVVLREREQHLFVLGRCCMCGLEGGSPLRHSRCGNPAALTDQEAHELVRRHLRRPRG